MEATVLRPRFQPSVEREQLREALGTVQTNETITYETLSEAVGGRDVREGKLRSMLASARNDLLKAGVVFDSVRNVGLMRLDSAKVIHGAKAGRRKINKVSTKEFRKLGVVADYEALSLSDQIAHALGRSLFAAITATAAEETIKQLASSIKGKVQELPLTETLKALIECKRKA